MAVNTGNIQTQIKGGGKPSSRIGDSVIAYGTGYITGGSATVSVGDSPALDVTPNAAEPSEGEALPPSEVIVYDKDFVKAEEMA